VETPDNQELHGLPAAYKGAAERWITAIKTEESLAVPDHSILEQEAGKRAEGARKAYEDALRRVLLAF
jgi:hypothetical protein